MSTTLITRRKTSGLLVNPSSVWATVWGTCSLARIQLRSAEAPMISMIWAVMMAVSRKMTTTLGNVTLP